MGASFSCHGLGYRALRTPGEAFLCGPNGGFWPEDSPGPLGYISFQITSDGIGEARRRQLRCRKCMSILAQRSSYTPATEVVLPSIHYVRSVISPRSPPDPMNHVKMFKGCPPRDAPSKLVQLWCKSFPSDQRGLVEMKSQPD